MAISHLGYEIDSSQAKRAAVDLDKMTLSSERAEKSARDLTTATRTEATATGQLAQAVRQTSTATAQMERAVEAATGSNIGFVASSRSATAALHAQGAAATVAARLTRQQMVGLGYQLNDVATMLLMGASPFQIIASQGGQVVQLMGDGPGGMRGSVRALGSEVGSLATRLAPVGIAIATLGTGVAALRGEINETSDATVSFGDVALGVWQMLAEGFTSTFRGPIETVQGWWKTLWENVESFAVDEFNSIARNVAQLGNQIKFAVDIITNHWEGSVQTVKDAWALLPEALGDLTYQAAQKVLDGVVYLAREAISILNGAFISLQAAFDKVGFDVAMPNLGNPMDVVPRFEIDNPWAGSASELGGRIKDNAVNTIAADLEAFRRMQSANAGLEGRDFFGELKAKATANAFSDVEQAATGAGGAIGRAANDNKDAWAGLRDVTEETGGAMEQIDSWAQSFGSKIANTLRQGGDLWDAWKEAGLDAVAKVGEAWITSGIQQMLGGFGGGGGGGGFWSNLFSWLPFANGAAFDHGNVIPFAAGGVVSGPTAFPMSGGRTGLMGEAGPEAIMPLRRGRDGRLGVAATNQNQPAPSVTINQTLTFTGVVTPDEVRRMGAQAGQEAGRQAVQHVKDNLPGWQTDIQRFGRLA